ncbi:MAG TPA: hypothetical protein VG733_11740 [Chthoniobacteraceae bacterium]|nr:hypothetical protein [Chthoniobacteraceae bacterium]
METNTADSQPPPHDPRGGNHRANAFSVIAVILLLVEFVLPGFALGGERLAESRRIITPGNLFFPSPALRGVIFFFAPAFWLAGHCKPVGDFYEWEIRLVWH